VASYGGPFAEWLGDRDYGLVSMKNQVLMAAGFSKWLGQKGIELSDLSDEMLGVICWTERILEATLAMKEAALAKTSPYSGKSSRSRPDDNLLGFLNSL
jgi:hypothetical protein